MTNALDTYAGIHALWLGLEKQGDTHGAVSICVDGIDAAQATGLMRLCADGMGIYGSSVNRPGSGSVLVDDPLGGCSVRLDLLHLKLTLGIVNVTYVQRGTLDRMLRALSCRRCGEPLSWGDYEHDSGGACCDCYYDALADAS